MLTITKYSPVFNIKSVIKILVPLNQLLINLKKRQVFTDDLLLLINKIDRSGASEHAADEILKMLKEL